MLRASILYFVFASPYDQAMSNRYWLELYHTKGKHYTERRLSMTDPDTINLLCKSEEKGALS